MHTGRGQLLYINHLKCTLYFHFCTPQCYSETLQSHYILPRLLILLNVCFPSPDWQRISCWCHVARLSALQTEDRNIYQRRKDKAKSLDLTTEGKKKPQIIQLWLRRHPHTVVDPKKGAAIGDYACISSEERPRANVLPCGKAGRSYATGDAAPGTHRCVLAGSGCGAHEEGLGHGRAGEQEPSHPLLTRSLHFSFIHWLSLQCLPRLQQRFPDSIFYLLSTQPLRTQILGV